MQEQQITDTETLVKDMLVERVGHSILDSGDYYGRNYQTNQQNPPWEKPRLVYWDEEYLPSLNVYHFFTELDDMWRDEESAEFEAKFRAWVDDQPIHDAYYNSSETIRDFCKAHGYEILSIGNTYNSENSVSQGWQWATLQTPGGIFTGIAIHGGCDVRGGYADFRFFTTQEDFYAWSGPLRWYCYNCGEEGEEFCKEENFKLDPENHQLLCSKCDNPYHVTVN